MLCVRVRVKDRVRVRVKDRVRGVFRVSVRFLSINSMVGDGRAFPPKLIVLKSHYYNVKMHAPLDLAVDLIFISYKYICLTLSFRAKELNHSLILSFVLYPINRCKDFTFMEHDIGPI